MKLFILKNNSKYTSEIIVRWDTLLFERKKKIDNILKKSADAIVKFTHIDRIIFH